MSLRVIHKDHTTNTCLVRNGSKPSFPVTMMSWLKNLVCVGDLAIVKKSPVSGEWIMTDYIRYMGDVDNE